MRRTHVAWLIFGIVFAIVASQAALAPSLAGVLRRGLARQASEYTALDVRVAPVGWLDLARGHLRQVEIDAREIAFGGPRLARLTMHLEKIEFSTARLLARDEAIVTGLGPSRVTARVAAAALNEYRRLAYPSVPAVFQIRPTGVGLIGSLRILGRNLSVRTSGRLQAESGDRLRYVPASIEVAGQQVPIGWLASYGQDIGLDIPLALPLPLALRQVQLGEGYLDLTWTAASAGETNET